MDSVFASADRFSRKSTLFHCVLSAELRSPRRGQLELEAVTLCEPVMPIADSFGCSFVGIDGGQLRQGNGNVAAVLADQDEHVAGTDIFRCQAPYLDGFSLSQW